ncbi:MAG: NAD-dependent epimerase/dehydratase family protein [Acidobacteriaceae bacterium]
MRALVTGASGFLGGRLAQMLVERGDEVRILARAGARLEHLQGSGVEVVAGGLTDLAALREAVRGRTHIFHCAACSTDWAPERTYFESNVLGTGMLCEAAAGEPKLERMVHVSTTDVYGYPRLPGDETAATADVGLPYNRTKLQGEMAVREYGAKGLPVTVIRPATIYGPRGKDFVVEIAKMLRQRMMLLVDGGRRRGGFCYVDNVASAMILVCAESQTAGETYNISDGTDVTWREYVGALAAGLGLGQPWIDLPFGAAMGLGSAAEAVHGALRLPGRPLLTRHAVHLLGKDQEFPATKAAREFGYTAEISFAEGMRRTVGWVKGKR